MPRSVSCRISLWACALLWKTLWRQHESTMKPSLPRGEHRVELPRQCRLGPEAALADRELASVVHLVADREPHRRKPRLHAADGRYRLGEKPIARVPQPRGVLLARRLQELDELCLGRGVRHRRLKTLDDVGIEKIHERAVCFEDLVDEADARPRDMCGDLAERSGVGSGAVIQVMVRSVLHFGNDACALTFPVLDGFFNETHPPPPENKKGDDHMTVALFCRMSGSTRAAASLHA